MLSYEQILIFEFAARLAAALSYSQDDELFMRAHSNPSQFSENANPQTSEALKRQFLNESNIRKLPLAEFNLSDVVIEKLLELKEKGIDEKNSVDAAAESNIASRRHSHDEWRAKFLLP